MGQAAVRQESDGEGLRDVIGCKIARGDEETALSMNKIQFNANDEGTILQSNRNAKMTIEYKCS